MTGGMRYYMRRFTWLLVSLAGQIILITVKQSNRSNNWINNQFFTNRVVIASTLDGTPDVGLYAVPYIYCHLYFPDDICHSFFRYLIFFYTV